MAVTVKTVAIVWGEGEGYAIIAAADFDPKVHQLYSFPEDDSESDSSVELEDGELAGGEEEKSAPPAKAKRGKSKLGFE